MEVSGQFHAPAALPQYPPNSRLGGLVEKMSLGHTGIPDTTLQSRSPSVVTILTELSRRTSSFTTERSSLEADSSSAVKEFATIFTTARYTVVVTRACHLKPTHTFAIQFP